ncbi:MAG: glycosyltransferase [Candidatus Methylarchaceae archaeon HK01B]|nr:glycosyltransferase [Candidatus Methylarchaceae archaeon HK01B]
MSWALDDHLDLTRRALEGIVEFTDLDHCEVVHSVWWERLLNLPKKLLLGKRIICHMSSRPFHFLKQPRFLLARKLVGRWIVRTKEAQRELHSVGIDCELIPFTIDKDLFRPLLPNDSALIEMRQRWDIPSDCYLIGNFHRDTEGSDLRTPKALKGPDIFAEILLGLFSRGYRVHVLLAGPRRFWIRRRLAELRVPFTFIGDLVEGTDDIGINTLPRPTLNLLYNLLDLYLITSRCEGAPRTLMESVAAQCKVISTRVGLAEDILEPACIYSSPPEAVNIIERDIHTNSLEATIEPQFHRILNNHTTDISHLHFRRLYERLESIPVYTGEKDKQVHAHSLLPFTFRLFKRIVKRPIGSPFTVGIWHEFYNPPNGGGNQFMITLSRALQQRGVRVVENRFGSPIDAYIFNSVHFDIEKFRQSHQKRRLKILHRINGPIYPYRGSSPDLDHLCFEFNMEFASATVLLSAWSYQRIVEMGYEPVNPVIIHNAVDPVIFHPRGRIPFDRKRKIRLISTMGTGCPRKEWTVYKWINDHLDLNRFEYTLVGRGFERFNHVRHFPPVPSEQLADFLRQHDIYIIASQNDPCSIELIEALACGLPVLYLNDGGHSELVGYGGLPFKNMDEILPKLETLVENYKMFQNLILVPSLDDAAKKYLTLLQEVADSL